MYQSKYKGSEVDAILTTAQQLQNNVETLQAAVKVLNGNKQDTLIAGQGIIISGNRIYSTVSPFVVVNSLPATGIANTVYLVKKTDDEDTYFSQYVYLDNEWQSVGKYNPTVDLSSLEGVVEQIKTQVEYIDEQINTLGESGHADLQSAFDRVDRLIGANTEAINTIEQRLDNTPEGNTLEDIDSDLADVRSRVYVMENSLQVLSAKVLELETKVNKALSLSK